PGRRRRTGSCASRGWYARVLNPGLTPATTVQEEETRVSELCELLKRWAEELSGVRDNLKRLATVLGGSVEPATLEMFGRLEAGAATTTLEEFLAVVRENYPTSGLFQAAHDEYDRSRRLTTRYAELQSTRSYLDGLARVEDANLRFDAEGLKTRLS